MHVKIVCKNLDRIFRLEKKQQNNHPRKTLFDQKKKKNVEVLEYI